MTKKIMREYEPIPVTKKDKDYFAKSASENFFVINRISH